MDTNEIKQLFQNHGITIYNKQARLMAAYSKAYGIDPHKILCDALGCVSLTVVNVSMVLLCSEINSMSAPLEP